MLKKTLLAVTLISSMSVVGAENPVNSTSPKPNIITSSTGVIIRLKKIPLHSDLFNVQIPVIKRLSTKDTLKIKKNIIKENSVIEVEISNLYRKSNDGIVALETTVELTSESDQYTSIAINKNISNATERYFIWNILIDKSTGLMISPNRAFKKFGLPLANVQSQITDWIKPCLNPDRKSVPDKCMDAEVDSFIQEVSYNGISSIKPSGVYLRNGNLGVSFDTNKFSPSFEFDLKTKKIVSMQ